ncbi:hypothetical protein ABEB36_010473 [Hypothenemus hampei]|uniref:Potassium channel domain-containing protein n=1 Tax=Hypothenemus hampei TaxID=57062 RepID=A0ABD1EJU6_HYPHA
MKMQSADEEVDLSNTKKCSLSMFCGRTTLCLFMTGYALLGALLFKFVEGDHERPFVADFQRSREDCLKELWIITETASIQIASTHSTPNHVSFQGNHTTNHYVDHHEIPKRAILATVRATHTRGRCRQGPIRQILTDPNCPAHRHGHGSPLRNSIVGISTDVELEEVDENDESDQGQCHQHDTPSRIPLIWRPPDKNGISTFSATSKECAPPSHQPSVPIILVVIFFFSYMGIGAVCLANTDAWTFLDAIYFCFLALSTIGVGDKLPDINYKSDVEGQFHVFACCLYIFLGLIMLATCFSLIHEELTTKCRQLANNLGLVRDE